MLTMILSHVQLSNDVLFNLIDKKNIEIILWIIRLNWTKK